MKVTRRPSNYDQSESSKGFVVLANTERKREREINGNHRFNRRLSGMLSAGRCIEFCVNIGMGSQLTGARGASGFWRVDRSRRKSIS